MRKKEKERGGVEHKICSHIKMIFHFSAIQLPSSRRTDRRSGVKLAVKSDELPACCGFQDVNTRKSGCVIPSGAALSPGASLDHLCNFCRALPLTV